ncbi:unnamed protein product [Notodromas monacha]|uniref:Ras-GEF domain-containing protein n=1 Tax=Notodromas monacha TaxID=399045 RepID=A0A7R9BKF9_9CRUS|nr:unnamed protein product [Notodromas monacha]CAG0916888.1 unnamed protein product [Notodromas monacha]
MRAKVICHLLKTCRHLKTLQNLNSEAALVSALRNAAIYRLYKTWALVPTKEKDYLSRRSEFLLEKGQFRVFLEGAAPPCVPFLGPFLTELITVEEAYRDADGSNCASVESRKRKMDDVLHGVLRFQTSNYQKLRSVEALQRYINSRKYINALFKFTEDELYKRSLTLEPQESPSRRPSNSEKITFSIGSPTKTFSRTRSVASLIIQQTSSLVAGNVAMLGNLENLVCGKEGKFPFSHRKARSLETRTNIAEDGYKRSAEMSDKPRSVSTCITPICLMGDVTRSSLSAESAHDQYDLNGEQGNPAQMGSHQRALGSVSSSVSSMMLYPGSHGSWYGSVVRRRALKKNHRKVRWAKQKDYWMELHGCRLFMFSHRLLGDK